MKKTAYFQKAIWFSCLCVMLAFPAQAQQPTATDPPAASNTNTTPPTNGQIPMPNTAGNIAPVTHPSTTEPTSPLVVSVVSDPNEMVLKYEAFLQEETKEHREFIQGIYKQVVIIITAILAIAGFFGVRSWKDLKSQAYASAEKKAEEGIQKAITGAIEKRTKWLEKTQKASRDKVFREFKSIFSKQISNHNLPLPTVQNSTILKGKKVLWVDDDPVGIACQVAILEGLKMIVVVVQSTDEAMEKLGEDGYALVISNMNRDPDPIAGIELSQTIRKNSKIPILIFTKKAHIDNYSEKAKEVGVNVLESNPDRIVPQIEQLVSSSNKTTILT